MVDPQDAHAPSSAQVATLRRRLLAWYEAHRRDLPWRRTRDPYAIWVSEVMLQQTRVDTVIPYYERFLRAHPTVAALADAPLEEVLAGWSGLGYYRRARALHAAARHVRDVLDGVVPRTAEGLRSIHGIGPYTAGAIASIAFGERAPLVDGNVARVLARLFGVEDDVASTRGRARLWALAEELVDPTRPGDWNQALMELGATVCTPRSPACGTCPVRAGCVAFRDGRVEELPKKGARKTVPVWRRVALVAARGDEVLLARRAPEGLFGGMWEPPTRDDEGDADARAASLAALVGARLEGIERVGAVTHVLSHRRLEIEVLRARVVGRPRLVGAPEYDALAWAKPGAGDRGISTLAKKLLVAAGHAVSARKRATGPGRRSRPG